MRTWLEVVKIRSLDELAGPLVKDWQKEMDGKEGAGRLKIRIFRHAFFPTDFSVHLYWQIQELTPWKSQAGLKLSQVVKDLGLVNHSLWIEEVPK